MFDVPDMTRVVAAALAEDLGVEPERLRARASPDPDLLDATSPAFACRPDARFVGRDRGPRGSASCAGCPSRPRVFEALVARRRAVRARRHVPARRRGRRVEAGTEVAEVEGPPPSSWPPSDGARLPMVLSGIATETARWVVRGRRQLAVCDTRKTVPGMRALSKYAVRVGGGTNHRVGLYDMVLVKDNHIAPQRAASPPP